MSARRRRLRGLVLALLSLTAVLTAPPAAVAAERAKPERSRVVFHRWTDRADFAVGAHAGTVPGDSLRVAAPVGTTTYTDPHGGTTRTWEYARYTTAERTVGFRATELVASWTADTPPGTWLQVEMRGRTHTGTLTAWYVMGRWASGDRDVHRTSVDGQGDADGTVAVDTFVAAAGRALTAYQLRVTLHRAPGQAAWPAVRSLGAMASAVADRATVPASPGGVAWGVELDVPRRSQEIHLGEYPEYDGGGEAWCSPTSTTMVMEYWGRGPSERDLAWVDPSVVDPQVDHAARFTYDYGYQGTGNWPFNTAYAGTYGLEGFVTRLRSLTELERFIAAGIPVITSQSFAEGELPGAGYGTDGHLMVVVGFTEDGDVIANDPYSDTNEQVRRVYPRAAFENVWQRASSSGGVVYVIHPAGVPLPAHPPGAGGNW
ncbi:C39 family peptidase [Allostreptomyces psammosilenae]|uniref:Peptidase C39-like domain-containing protein n=1 Tax=Allostreptomyces psammosilenae TaxID=1892865 RepID=A0A853A2U4_9ACTN|nr:C39 family peptidase [Allostreptomyces psammosilenae]NYI04788.1 hypothetical protein [Allostreptomyces psammosilenae]